MKEDCSDGAIAYDKDLDTVVALDGGPKPDDYDTPEDVVVTDEGIVETAQLLYEDTGKYGDNSIEVQEKGGFDLRSSKGSEVIKERVEHPASDFDNLRSTAYERGVAMAGISEASDTPEEPDYTELADQIADQYANEAGWAEEAERAQEGINTGTEDGLDYIEDQDLDLEEFEEPETSRSLLNIF